MKRKLTRGFLTNLLAAVGVVLLAWPTVAAELTDARFKELLAELQPSEDELWRTVPWNTDLLDAQRTAVQEDKPIFIWAMDGHPLGCT